MQNSKFKFLWDYNSLDDVQHWPQNAAKLGKWNLTDFLKLRKRNFRTFNLGEYNLIRHIILAYKIFLHISGNAKVEEFLPFSV